MGQPVDRQPHTLAQFARRAGISEGRARGMAAQSPSRLPRPDGADADGRPFWWASTIDAWCSRTGRAVSADSLWLHRAPAATTPAVELQRGVVRVDRGRLPVYAIVWDTDHGHVVYLQALESRGEHRDGLAHHAAELIEPRWWADAVVIMPIEQIMGSDRDQPIVYVYRLVDVGGGEEEHPPPQPGVRGGMRRLMRRAGRTGSARARAHWSGQVEADEVAAVIGRPLPVWLSGTVTVGNADRSLSYERTFTVADTVTDWPAIQTRLEQAIRVDMPTDFPAAFTALAFESAAALEGVRERHAQQPDSGPGWYLVCRPAPPAPSVELERVLTQAWSAEADMAPAAEELPRLRALEGDLDVDDERGDPYAEAITQVYWQMRRAALLDGTLVGDLTHGYLPVADDDHVIYSAPWSGPVVEAWARNLTLITDNDLPGVLRRRRVRRLLDHDHLGPDAVREAYRDDHGRYVLAVEYAGDVWSLAEWPKSLAVVDTWTDQTVLAADDQGGTVTLLALTPDNGRTRTDPVPMQPQSYRDAFGYGYGGGTPGTTYQAILRCALGDTPAFHATQLRPDSQLWNAISTTKGPLRLSWPQIKLWARADRRASETSTT